MNLKLKKLNILLEFPVKNHKILYNNTHLILQKLTIIIIRNNIIIEVALIMQKKHLKSYIYNN